MQPTAPINDHKRTQSFSSTPDAEIQQQIPKKRKTIEEVMRAEGLEIGNKAGPIQAPVNLSQAIRPQIYSGNTYQNYGYQKNPINTQPTPNGYNYQINSYISQTNYPLIGIFSEICTDHRIANYYSYNIVGSNPTINNSQFTSPLSLYQAVQQATAPKQYFNQPPPPTAAPPTAIPPASSFAPNAQNGITKGRKKSPWEKAPQTQSQPNTLTQEKSEILLKAINRISQKQDAKPQPAKPDILEDKTLPESARIYIINGFAKCHTAAEKDYMRTLLRQLMENAKMNGELFTKKWSETELPKLAREIQHPTITIPIRGNPIQQISLVPNLAPEELKKRNQRKNRFGDISEQDSYQKAASPLKIFNGSHNSARPTQLILPKSKYAKSEEDTESLDFGIKGTCTKLEKEYFRLTDDPDPSNVRPEEVLKKTLKLLKQKWKQKTADYAYICDQFRSIRQDMMVQRIKDEFAAEVYETHARIALESRDIAHFNQCQTQLDELFDSGVKGHKEEFLGYQILYAALHNMDIELSQILKKLTLKDKQNEAIKHSLKIVSALNTQNFHAFFKLYKNAPNMSSYLIDMFIERLRLLALISIASVYITGISIDLVTEFLAFENNEKCKLFIISAGGKINDTINKLDCKESLNGFRNSPILTKRIQ